MTNRNDSSRCPLKSALRDEIERPRLGDEQLQQLLQLQQSQLGDYAAPTTVGRWRYVAAGCAMLVLLLGFGLWQWQQANLDLSREIAREVAANHLKLKPLDVRAQSLRELRRYFTQLDFAPSSSVQLADGFNLDDRQMLGGRYCSIRGITAAQLRYGRNDDIVTFYQVGYDPQRHGEVPLIGASDAPRQILVKGVRVSLWREKGLLMVLAETEPQN